MAKIKKRNILFLTPRYPYPMIGGDRLKSFNLLKHLSSYHDVTLVTFYQGKGEYPPEEHIEEVKKHGIDLHIIPLHPVKAGMSILFKYLFKYPLEIGYYYQPEFSNKVNELIEKKNFDLSIAFFMRTAEYIKHQSFKKILMSEDCRRLYQKRSFEKSTNIIQKAVRWWEHRMLRKYEPDLADHFDVTTLVTHEDIIAMKEKNANANYALLSNGVDIDLYIPQSFTKKENFLLFTGKLDLWANYLMIRTIIKEILPKVREKLPETKLKIVGANPSKAIMSFQNEYIEVHANVPSLVPYLQKAAVFIHPHQGGSGIQNKLLEAMSCGAPVVTSPTGIQGIEAIHGKDIMIGKNSDEMVEHIIKLMTDKKFAGMIGKNARQLMVDTHSWQSIFNDIDNLIKSLFDNEEK